MQACHVECDEKNQAQEQASVWVLGDISAMTPKTHIHEIFFLTTIEIRLNLEVILYLILYYTATLQLIILNF